ncbi:MobF family relaxase [Nocardioides panzhihuensis]|uniref:Conjugative relaxase-like TrwC/TraI family protein n=1 Tax=Nocardioides panzhihuensis TaxID=860243 RepID=A0A7Z0DHN3_9ACTN|nr:MobF family relaxase [Nocardioides panzhihuensis]NYI75492.1 conjugative relaxase-like TrwC/TraI family protein [Nocardioides panzhihuensis]
MTIHKLAAGSGYEYLTRQVAAADSTELGSTPLADYYEAKGEAPGRWLGSGLADLSGIEPGQVVTAEQMGHLFGEGTHPVTGAALGRPQRKGGVAGFDLTFSPVKSVSALWAVAPPPVARAIEEAHEAAVADALAYVEREVLFTREGTDGARQVETRGLVAAAFRHRDTRAGDPDLHTHVAVANKVQTLGGKWLSIYGSVLFAHTVAISETYNTALEARLRERLGVRFTERAGRAREKRTVREIVGVDPGLCGFWSRRRLSIVDAERDLAETFVREHGRAPTAKEERALAQQANLATRDRKHDPVSEAEQRRIWRREAAHVLGSPDAVGQILRDAVAPRVAPPTGASPGWHSQAWVEEAAERVVLALEEHRATWQSWHLRAEAQRQVRAGSEVPSHVLPSVVASVEEVVRSRLINLTPEPPDHLADGVPVPALLHRRDGTSVYRHSGSDRYTSLRILEAEQRLVEAGALTSDFRFTHEEVEVSLRRAEIGGGLRLNAGQRALVRSMATSGHRLRVALAPAGSGKTTAVRALARVWADHGYPAVGLAPSAAAAAVLREATGMPCETLAKLDYNVTTALPGRDPGGFAGRIRAGSLVVIDEAGMADTPALARVVGHCLDRGATVRLVGDDQQLAAVGAGGVLRDIVTQYGADRLEEVVRFTDPAEAAASLDLRAGDPAALGFYFDSERIHTGDTETALAEVFDQWARAHAAEVDALMLAPTRDLVADLNARARAARLAEASSRQSRGHRGAEVALADGNQASVGDVVITRRNNRRLGLSGTDWVKNGDRWTITKVRRDGGLKVVNQASGLSVVLPPDYVADHLELGYASTVHTAQGLTAEAMYGIITGTETRQLLYTMLTRGRTENHLHVIIDPDNDTCGPDRGAPGAGTTSDPVLPGILEQLSVGPVLEEIIARDGAAVSATTVRLRGASTSEHLRDAVTRYTDAVTLATQHTYQGSWEDALEAAGQGPLPWLPAVPADVTTHETWGPYLSALGDLVTAQATTFRSNTDDQAHDTEPPTWAKRHADVLDKDRGLYDEIRLWRAATGVPDDDHRLTGKPTNTPGAAAYQRSLQRRYEAALPDSVQAWAEKVATYAGGRDEHTLDLARFLDRLDHDGHNAAAMLHRAAAIRPLPAKRASEALGYRIQQQLRPALYPPDPASGLRRPEHEISPTSGPGHRDPYRNNPGIGM